MSDAIPRIDFYILKAQTQSAYLLFICKLLQKAYQNKSKIFVYSDNAQLLQQLDDLLWTFADISFIPHAKLGNEAAKHAPILLTQQLPTQPQSIIINLSQTVPEPIAQFARIIEIVAEIEPLKSQARQRFKFYKDLNIDINTHKINS